MAQCLYRRQRSTEVDNGIREQIIRPLVTRIYFGSERSFPPTGGATLKDSGIISAPDGDY
jgi:hypothetical protein